MNILKLTSDVSSHEAVLIPGPWPKAYPSEQAIKSNRDFSAIPTTGHGMSLNEMNPVAYSSGGGQGGNMLEAHVAKLEAVVEHI
jgi:hypothetical protein